MWWYSLEEVEKGGGGVWFAIELVGGGCYVCFFSVFFSSEMAEMRVSMRGKDEDSRIVVVRIGEGGIGGGMNVLEKEVKEGEWLMLLSCCLLF